MKYILSDRIRIIVSIRWNTQSINFAADTEDYQPSERISLELVNGYRRNTQQVCKKSRKKRGNKHIENMSL